MAGSPLDIDGLGLDELKALLVQALERIARLEKENQKQRDEIARLILPEPPSLALTLAAPG